MVGLSNVLWNLIFYLIYIIILSFRAVWGVLLFRISNQKVFFYISILQVKHWKLLKDLPYFVKITCRSVNFYLSNRACRFTKKQVLLHIFTRYLFEGKSLPDILHLKFVLNNFEEHLSQYCWKSSTSPKLYWKAIMKDVDKAQLFTPEVIELCFLIELKLK